VSPDPADPLATAACLGGGLTALVLFAAFLAVRSQRAALRGKRRVEARVVDIEQRWDESYERFEGHPVVELVHEGRTLRPTVVSGFWRKNGQPWFSRGERVHVYFDPLFVSEVRMRAPLWPIVVIAFGFGAMVTAGTYFLSGR
jgi:hypothetical protein